MAERLGDALRRLLDSPCEHGYSARKRCPSCQKALSARRWAVEPRRKGKSVYADRP